MSSLSNKKILIIGCGISGAIAYGSLLGYNPTIFDTNKGLYFQPKNFSIMRFRNPEIGRVLGVDLKEIKVTKEILSSNYKTHYPPASQLEESCYSLKLYDELSDRSISKTNREDIRYVLEEEASIPNVVSAKLIDVDIVNHKAILQGVNSGASFEQEYDFLISTIPMPILLRILMASKFEKTRELYARAMSGVEIAFQSHSVFSIKIKITNTVIKKYRTIYVTDLRSPIYRMSLENNMVTIESTKNLNETLFEQPLSVGDMVSHLIPISLSEWPNFIGELEVNEIKMGKISPIKEEVRKGIMHHLTAEAGIFSFGRYAIWKAIRTDHLLDDIKKIINMMKSDNVIYDSFSYAFSGNKKEKIT